MFQIFGSRQSRSTHLGAVLIVGFMLAGNTFGANDTFDLDDYRGKVVIIDFWASWCVPCRRSFPWLNQMQKKYGDEGLVIVGVNMDASESDARTFLHDFPAEFEIHFDPTGVVAEEYKIEAMPSSFVINRDGVVVANHLGFKVKKQDDYEQVIRETLYSTEE